MKLIVGLCNPEERFRWTRHNSGLMIMESFLRKLNLNIAEKKFKGEFWGPIDIDGIEVGFLMPHTYMNGSGEAIKEAAAHYGIIPADILVISDDVALPFGKIRMRASGSSGRHKGLDSVFAEMGTSDIPRMKIGVGLKTPEYTLRDWVLGKFTEAEQASWPQLEEAAWKGFKVWLSSGVDRAMSEINSFTLKR